MNTPARVHTPNPSKMRTSFRTLIALTLLSASAALAQAPAYPGGGTSDPKAILKAGLCGPNSLTGYMTDPVIIGVSLVLVFVIGFWAARFGNRNATQQVLTGLICSVGLLSASTLASAFVQGC